MVERCSDEVVHGSAENQCNNGQTFLEEIYYYIILFYHISWSDAQTRWCMAQPRISVIINGQTYFIEDID